EGRIIPETRIPAVSRARGGEKSVVRPANIAVIHRLHEFLGDHHRIRAAILDAGESGFERDGADDAVPRQAGDLVDPSRPGVGVFATRVKYPWVVRGVVSTVRIHRHGHRNRAYEGVLTKAYEKVCPIITRGVQVSPFVNRPEPPARRAIVNLNLVV